MKTFLAWGVEETIMHEVYYFANKIQHILCIFCMLATYKLKQIMWRTTISVQYFTAQVPEKISELKAKVKLTRRSCFNKWSPLTLPALQRLVIDLFNRQATWVGRYWKTSWAAELLLFSPEWSPMTVSNCCFGCSMWTSPPDHSKGSTKLSYLLRESFQCFSQNTLPPES